MALIKCPECGKEISSEADVCPNCGISTRKKKKENGGIRAVCYITDVASFLFAIAGYGNWFTWIPLIWAIGFTIYCSSKNEEKEDISFYKKLKRENFIVFIVVFITMVIVVFARDQWQERAHTNEIRKTYQELIDEYEEPYY